MQGMSIEYQKHSTSLKCPHSLKRSLINAKLFAEADIINGKIADICHLHINKKKHHSE